LGERFEVHSLKILALHDKPLLKKTCSAGVLVAGTPDCASYIINVDIMMADLKKHLLVAGITHIKIFRLSQPCTIVTS